MAERITRPPVRLRGGLPDGTLTGITDDVTKAMLGEEPEPVYALVQLGRRQLVHDDEAGSDVAVLAVLAVEVLADGVCCPQCDTPAWERLSQLRSERIGDNPIDFDGAASAEYAQLSELRRQLAEYAAEEGMSDVTVGKDVMATVPGAGAGWRDSPQILGEYLRTKGVLDDPPAGGDG